jgi:hypothetical protein
VAEVKPASSRQLLNLQLLAAASATLMLQAIMLTTCSRIVLASVPFDLTNFQNKYPCDPNATLIVRLVMDHNCQVGDGP